MIREPNSVTIDLSALVHNLRHVRMLTGQDKKIMGVIKSDAYGHGLLPIARTLEKNRIDCLGVAYLNEALELRKHGIKLPVVVLCGIHTHNESRKVVEKDLCPVVFDLNTAELLDRESMRQGKRTSIYIKIDTGMGRLGIPHTETGEFIRKVAGFRNLDLEGLTSHLSSADESSGDFTTKQIEYFIKAIEVGRSMGLKLPSNSLANSAGIMTLKNSRFEMVRPGIMLYGGTPSLDFESPVHLKPVMHFKGRILQIRDLPDHTPVSYGRTYHTKGPCRVAILSAGYGDGLPRRMSNRGSVLIRGKKVPIIGRICMDLTISDISGLENAERGDDVVFLGPQGKETITGDDLAGWADTISYEVLCAIGHQNKKEYIS